MNAYSKFFHNCEKLEIVEIFINSEWINSSASSNRMQVKSTWLWEKAQKLQALLFHSYDILEKTKTVRTNPCYHLPGAMMRESINLRKGCTGSFLRKRTDVYFNSIRGYVTTYILLFELHI